MGETKNDSKTKKDAEKKDTDKPSCMRVIFKYITLTMCLFLIGVSM